jgi:hypothetical protein
VLKLTYKTIHIITKKKKIKYILKPSPKYEALGFFSGIMQLGSRFSLQHGGNPVVFIYLDEHLPVVSSLQIAGLPFLDGNP